MTKEYITKNRAKQFVCGHCNEVCSEEPCEPSDCDWMAFIDKEPAADVVPVVHGELTEHIRELLRAEKDGRLVVLPCRVGDRIYRVIDDCTFPGDCGTKRMCKGCEYRNLFIEQTTFRLYLLTDDGKLRRGYYRTREEAETALEGNKDY